VKLIALAFLIVSTQVVANDFAEVELEAKQWYETSYAKMWRDAVSIDLEKVRDHYIEGYRIHIADGGFQTADNSNEEWLETLKYFGDTWVGSDLVAVEVNAFNKNAVAIRSKWVNRNRDGTTSSNCANYVVGRSSEGRWRFYDLFIIDCSARQTSPQ
jgi:hypothetical protein